MMDSNQQLNLIGLSDGELDQLSEKKKHIHVLSYTNIVDVSKILSNLFKNRKIYKIIVKKRKEKDHCFEIVSSKYYSRLVYHINIDGDKIVFDTSSAIAPEIFIGQCVIITRNRVDILIGDIRKSILFK